MWLVAAPGFTTSLPQPLFPNKTVTSDHAPVHCSFLSILSCPLSHFQHLVKWIWQPREGAWSVSVNSGWIFSWGIIPITLCLHCHLISWGWRRTCRVWMSLIIVSFFSMHSYSIFIKAKKDAKGCVDVQTSDGCNTRMAAQNPFYYILSSQIVVTNLLLLWF